MVQEQLGQEAQILAVDWVLGAVDLEHCDFILLVPVNLVARWVEQGATLAVPLQLLLQREEAQTELA